ncbi:hypothetical protein CK516_26430 [Nostoc sp. 'Peltigera malacea cyanobiont' DB3992]|nr:hypothetical protein CK516_26430 [Nostoc sp. 'Peltigera malacea cyanobiont' DB3992]
MMPDLDGIEVCRRIISCPAKYLSLRTQR